MREIIPIAKKDTDLLIIIPPLGVKNTVYPPYGAMYIASALMQKGYKPKILDADAQRITNKEIIREVKRDNPRYIGFSGIIATSYKYIKELSMELRRALPDRIQILGGGLASAAEPVLKNTSIDVIVSGEGDATIVELLDCLEKKNNLAGVSGIYYRKDRSSVYTGKRPLIGNLDTLPYPAFDLIDMDKYLPDGRKFIRFFTTKFNDKRLYERRRKRRMVTIPTSRGCFNECSFCFRAYPGLRVHSVNYVFDFIEYCIEKFNAGFFTFGDECFAPNKARNWEFINEFKKRDLNIIFRILGMRVDTVDPDILRAYKEIGCWMIEYGFESGSQKMLNIINKGVTVKQNKNAAAWTKEAGICTSPAFVLGMPGETNETVQETVTFLNSLNFDFKLYQWKYAIPIPGSRLYDFSKITGIIENEDEYLSSLAGEAADGAFSLNLTDEADEIVAGWAEKLKNAQDRHYLYDKLNIGNTLVARAIAILLLLRLHCRRGTLLFSIREKIKSLFQSIYKRDMKSSTRGKSSRSGKKINLKIEKFIEGNDCSSVNRAMSLKRINERLKEELNAQKAPGVHL